MRPLVSILIPAYNADKWIADTIKSARAQTWSRKEIIVVDDGSRDETLSVARRFESPEISVVTQTNSGAAAARNNLLARCQGDLIQWLDADDLLAPDKIEKQMAVWERVCSKQTLLSATWGSFMWRTHKIRFNRTSLWCDLPPTEWLLRKLEGNVYMQTAAWLTSRNLTEKAGPWDTRMLGDDDGEYFCRVIAQSDEIRFVAEAQVFYRLSGASSLSYVGCCDKKLEALLLSMRLHIGYLRSLEDSDRVREAAVTYLQSGLPLFFPHRPDLVKQMEEIAMSLGGKLQPVRLPWKYAGIQKAFGWNAAKWAQIYYNRSKASIMYSWDKILFGLENRTI